MDLGALHRGLREEIDAAIRDVCDGSSFILGPAVPGFESAFAEYLGVARVAGVGCGADALTLSFRALGIGEGDEVLVPAHTFVGTAIGVMRAGARPVLVDVDAESYLIDLGLAEEAVTARTRAICPVHLYGRACDMDAVTAFAAKHGLRVVEDAAQGHGALWRGRRVGSWGDAGCFSFYPAKNLGALGDGGAVATDSAETDARIRALRNYGSEAKYHHPVFGFNSRLDAVQAAVLSVKLRHLDEWNSLRWRAAVRYGELLDELSRSGDVHLPDVRTQKEHVFHLYVIQCDRRDAAREFLAASGIEAGIHYPNPFYLEDGYGNLGYVKGAFPVTEAAASRILTLPLHPMLGPEDQARVAERLIAFFRGP